jgi:CheY-like chemotaxis protein/cytidylate kinase
MTIISITNGVFSDSGATINLLKSNLNCRLITDDDIIEKTALDHDIKVKTILKTIDCKNIAFNDYTHEKEKCIAALKKTIAGYVSQGNIIFQGILGHLIPNWTTHIVKVLIITDKKHRIAHGISKEGLSEEEVIEKIHEADKHAILWTNSLFGKKAWDESLYDIVIPTDKVSSEDAAKLIIDNAEKCAHLSGEIVAQEQADFALTATVEYELAGVGSRCTTRATKGDVTVAIEENVLMLSKLKRKINDIASAIDGVKSVDVTIGKNFYDTSITRKYEFETPTRILLVDDEKEFVQTLSERLKMRQLESDFVYSGKEALDFTDREDTEVMVLDLKMPGIDGFEVLKQVKKSKPGIEVIILTGHGSEADRKTCMDLGAFAYLQKPADIDLLTSTMKAAYDKINSGKAQHSAS